MQQIVANRLSATKFIEEAQKRLLQYARTNRELAKANADEAIKSKDHLHQRKLLTQRCKQMQELIAIHKDNAHHLTLRHEALTLQYERHTLHSQQERDRAEVKQRDAEAEVTELQTQLDKARDEVREERRLRRELVQRQSELDLRVTVRSEQEGRVAMVSEELARARREAAELRDRLDAQQMETESMQRVVDRQREQLQVHTTEVHRLQQRVEHERDERVAVTAQLQQRTSQQEQAKVQLAESELRIGDLQQRLEEATVELEQRQRDASAASERLQSLEAMRDTYRQQAEHEQRVAAKLDEALQARGQLEQQIEDAHVDLAISREETEAAEAAYSALRASHVELQAVVSELSGELRWVQRALQEQAALSEEEPRLQRAGNSALGMASSSLLASDADDGGGQLTSAAASSTPLDAPRPPHLDEGDVLAELLRLCSMQEGIDMERGVGAGDEVQLLSLDAVSQPLTVATAEEEQQPELGWEEELN